MRALIEWKAYAWISLGALLGANLRYLLGKVVTRLSDAAFPYGTLVINISRSLLLGFFLVWTTERVLANPLWRGLDGERLPGAARPFFDCAEARLADAIPRH